MASSKHGGSGVADGVSAQAYVHKLTPILAAVTEQIDGPIQQAADLITTALRTDGVIQAFGSGHSEALAMEIAGRAGGLIATNRIALRDLVLLGGAPVELLRGGELERDPSIARRLFELAEPHPTDLFVIASNSGVN
ncbi:MAG TPA: SIS domain-containing protein, partial [Kribbella sp.]|nr:SIS domain-containing protein [Kribbella sp.]